MSAASADGGAFPPRTLAEAAKLFRRLDQPGFMRYGRPDDYGEFREMRKYILDTDICVYLSGGEHPVVARRFAELKHGEPVISAVTLAELHYGAATMEDPAQRDLAFQGVDKLLRVIPAVPFDEDAALAYAHVRMADPKRNIRAMDKLIAAHAIALNLILVTNNIKDFRKFRPVLRVENWAVAKH